MCLPAQATLRAGIHSLCVVCLGAKHAESALKGVDCPHCEQFPLRMLHSPKALFEEGDFTSVPRGAGPAFAEAEQWLRPWESQMDQVEGMKTGESLSSSFPIRSSARSLELYPVQLEDRIHWIIATLSFATLTSSFWQIGPRCHFPHTGI